MEDFIPVREPSDSRLREPDLLSGNLRQYAEIAKEWAVRNPVPCLAAAFVAGVALAWIIKRK
jgi:hypothetical protein